MTFETHEREPAGTLERGGGALARGTDELGGARTPERERAGGGGTEGGGKERPTPGADTCSDDRRSIVGSSCSESCSGRFSARTSERGAVSTS